MTNELIAIVGRSCVLPGAFTPDQFWQRIADGDDLIRPCSPDRLRVAREAVLKSAGEYPHNTARTDRGGYVEGFERAFDPRGFAIPAAEILPLDELFQWVLHTGREALRDAGIDAPHRTPPRTGAVLGILGLPTESLVQFAESVWLRESSPVDPRNRFCGGFPAHLLAHALQLDRGAFALDAACASSLYAIKLACDALQEGEADVMLAGAVSRADALYLQIGFSSLSAVSPSGRTRPFSADADGLLPAEGASFVVLRRLTDALREGNRIHGVIRGIGAGNDGRTAALLAPSARGQAETMLSAYERSGLEPAQISLIECHATGTPVGDVCEIRSTGRVFAGLKDIPIGSVKSNLGHPMTVAGMAGLLKILGAMRAGIRPKMLHVDSPASQVGRLASSPFRLLSANEPWDTPGPRRAALSAFGFGGNNSHMIVEEWTGAAPPLHVAVRTPLAGPVAVIAVGAAVGSAPDVPAFARGLFLNESISPRMESIELEYATLGFPPHDLEAALSPQTASLSAATEALSNISRLPSRSTGVFVGAGVDPEIARLSLQFRRRLLSVDFRVCPPLTAAAVIGRLANIVANRISSKYDLRGVSFTVLGEETSGLTALDLACRALRRGELDAAIVGASDLACEAVHEAAMAALHPEGSEPALDAACFMVLKRLPDAEAAGDRILAIVPDGAENESGRAPALRRHGNSYSASGMLQAVEAVLCCATQAIGPERPWMAAHPGEALSVRVNAMGGGSACTAFLPSRQIPLPLIPKEPASIFVYAGEDRTSLRDAIRRGRQSSAGDARLAIVARGEAELARRREQALRNLESPRASFAGDGIWFRERPLGGETAFVFPGSAAAYKNAGGSLLLAFPETLASVREWAPGFVSAASWLFSDRDRRGTPADKLWACTALTQCHVHLSREILGVRADAALGMSSGESNALFAFNVWSDADAFGRDLLESELFERHLGGSFDVLGGKGWETWLFATPEHEMRRIAAAEPGLRILAIHMPGEYLAAGEPAAMQRAIRLLGNQHTRRVDFDLVVHAPDALPFAEVWRTLHHRKSQSPPAGVRFYQMATGRAFEVNSDSVADSLTAQVLTTLDFPRLIENAWADGVRVFLEHGPRGGCSTWIKGILGDREYAAIPFDLPGVDSLTQAANAIAQLFVAGVSVEYQKFNDRLAPPQESKAKKLRLAAHLPVIEPPAPAAKTQQQPVYAAAVAAPAVQRNVSASVALFASHAAGLAGTWQSYLQHAHDSFQSVLQTVPPAPAQRPARALPPIPQYPDTPPAPRPKFTRADLEKTASGKISEVFGPMFEPLDHYRRIVRLPMPPMLLADRIVSMDAEPGSMGIGSLLAETDIVAGAWYVHRGRMPAGVVIESGQADMLLISWLGIDFIVKGERIYRLLGCDLTYHGEMPGPGVTLRYHIRITGHARQGGVRIFFFEYDCHAGDRLVATVRNAQAGFFTDDELKNSVGILWSAEETVPRPDVVIPPPRMPGLPRSYTPEQLRAAASGDAYACFGKGYEVSAAQQRPPAFANSALLLIDSISVLDFSGGPWGRGYLRAEYPVHPDNWLFECHFKDDPCLPGTLMFEGAIQCMAFYLMALGYTLERDGWRFEPVPGEPYLLRCRGQITPESKLMLCEIFVEEIVEGPEPILYAHVLGSVDGRKAFHCRRMAVRMAPGHPLDDEPQPAPDPHAVAQVNGVRLDRNALLKCALGLPSEAFGAPYARFDRYERCPRLPAPPYHFIHRIAHLEGDFGVERAGSVVEAEFDLAPGDWYFTASRMAFAALLEVGLQPCGWLSCYSGIPLRSKPELYFRNLDGNAVIHAPVPEGPGVLRTRAVLSNISRSGPVTLTSFDVTITLNGNPVLEMKTGFGFFRKEDLAHQAGLPPAATEMAAANTPSNVSIDLLDRPARFFAGPLRLPQSDLLMIDRITGLWPDRIRAEKTVRPSDWSFKAHFYGDPVQPGSLGVEAILQTAHCLAIEMDLAREMPNARIECVGPIVWKYRGQVFPANRQIQADVSLLSVRRDASQTELDCEGWLWTDGSRIYHVARFTLRIS